MNYKRLTACLLALCLVTGASAGVNNPIISSVTALAESETVDMGKLQLDNSKPEAQAVLSGLDKSKLVWSSTDTSVATVDGEGNIKAVGKGECKVRAACDDKIYEVTVISEYEEKEAETQEVDLGTIMFTNEIISKQIQIDVPDGTKIKFSSTDEDVATVDENGVVTAQGMGRCIIYAEVGNIRYFANIASVYTGESAGVKELGEIDLTPDNPMQTLTLSNVPEGEEIIWSCSDESIAVISANGVVSGIKEGTCKAYAEVGGKKYSLTINVYFNIGDIMQDVEITGKGGQVTLTFQSMTDDVVYTSSDESIAVIDKNGTVTAMDFGETVIKAESSGGTVWVRIKVTEITGKYIAGDANCDGEVNIADATAIIQHIGNQDRYGLSNQGLLNADVDGSDGVTGMDALVLQKYEAGMVKTLPLAPES